MRGFGHPGAVGDTALPSDLVPKDLEGNVRYRYELLRWSVGRPDRQQVIIDACARDLFFFTDAFVWVSDVRRYPREPDRPFIAWPFQREVMLDLDASIGRKHVGIVKSRDTGGSTIALIVLDRRLLHVYGQTMMVMSRTQRLVDDPRNPDSLFAKLDYMHRWMPSWMTASLERVEMSCVNHRTRSNIVGSSTTGDAGRGGRKQVILVDEFAAFDKKESFEVLSSVFPNSRCVVFASTPKGIGSGFHKIITEENISIHRCHWSKHPVHGRGLYTSENGRVKLLDEEFWRTTTTKDLLDYYPELAKRLTPVSTGGTGSDGLAVDGYVFVLDGQWPIRAPYFDHFELLCPIPRIISQELEMDFLGSGSAFFDLEEVRDYVRLFGKQPMHEGEITWDEDLQTVRWSESSTGRMQLWFHPDVHGRPPGDRGYIIGCDISAGTGASNSHLSVSDTRLRAKVGGMTTAHMRPEAFAEYVMAVGRWFNDARIVFEGSGCGSAFGARIKELGYANLYFMTRSSGVKAEKPGWFPNEEMKRNLLTEYGRALTMREFTNPDSTAVNECQMYEWTENGVQHVDASGSVDASGAKKNHGDRVVADALNWMLLRKVQIAEPQEKIKRDTVGWMELMDEQRNVNGNSWGPVDPVPAWSAW